MATDSFPLFAKLAPELQALIWDAAVRAETGPGLGHVHRFFMMDHYLNNANARAATRGHFLRFGPDGAPISGWMLAVPYDGPRGEANDSIYATDNGLWDACRDSRAAVERRFPANKWWSQLEYVARPRQLATSGQLHAQQEATHTASYRDDRGQVKHITITPQYDLIYLDPRGIDMVDWFHHYAGDSVPLFCDLVDSTSPSFLGPNFAIDYDPSMLDILSERPVHFRQRNLGMASGSLTDMIVTFHRNARKLWFVDHRLKSLSECSTAEVKSIKDRQIFYSDEAVYTEVTLEDMGTRWSLEQDDKDATQRSNIPVFDFFEAFLRMPPYYFEDEPTLPWRVLACQSRPGRTLQSWQPFSSPCTGETCPICGFETAKEMARRPVARRNINTEDDDDDGYLDSNWKLFDEDDE